MALVGQIFIQRKGPYMAPSEWNKIQYVGTSVYWVFPPLGRRLDQYSSPENRPGLAPVARQPVRQQCLPVAEFAPVWVRIPVCAYFSDRPTHWHPNIALPDRHVVVTIPATIFQYYNANIHIFILLQYADWWWHWQYSFIGSPIKGFSNRHYTALYLLISKQCLAKVGKQYLFEHNSLKIDYLHFKIGL